MIQGKKILVTGSAGFIGYHLVNYLCNSNNEVVGLDNINDYYDINLKHGRLTDSGIDINNIITDKCVPSSKLYGYKFIKSDLEDKENLIKLFEKENFDIVVNLAAQAGVRYSITNPYSYINSNIVGFMNILEMCRHFYVKHLVFASSSSVYGLNKIMPFSTSDNVDHPISLYAATKKSNELMAHTYSYLYNIPVTGLRFFTVYGPWGRPDMALFLFTKAIIENRPIDIYNYGNMQRDFTYIDDIVKGLAEVMKNIPEGEKNWSGEKPDPSFSLAPYKIYNIGNNNPVKLADFIEIIENELNIKAIKNFMEMQAGDVEATWANIDSLIKEIHYKPTTSIQSGIKSFIAWYKDFYNIE
jgi:UDP-glucuronate 4-epimerase